MSQYAASELREQLARGPQPEEDFFRLQVTGNGASKWVNITARELAAIVDVVEEDEES